MHRIRLREPWTTSLAADESAVIYSRKFHKPTGDTEQRIALVITLLPPDDLNSGEISAVTVNGITVEAQPTHSHNAAFNATNPESICCVYFQLNNLEPFNILVIRVTGSAPTTGTALPSSGEGLVPTFGSFVIQSVELQIE